MRHMNSHNKKLAEQGRKRAEMFLRLHINKKIPVVELARRYGMSRQRMSYLIKKASGGHG